MNRYRFVLLFCCFLYSLPGEAARVKFSKEELARESVLPVFDPMSMILGRNITLSKRLELGASLDFGLDDPFYFPVYVTGLLAFYISESHGVSFTATYFPPLKALPSWLTFLEWDGLRLKEKGIDVWRVPYPQMAGFLNYQYVPFYGKVSLTKKVVTNLSMYGFAGPGFVLFNEGALSVAGNMGMGLKLYFNRFLALRGILRFYGYYGPAPAKVPLKSQTSDLPYASIPSEQRGIVINLSASMGVVILI